MDLSSQYAGSENLAARIALHQRFSTNRQGLQRWVFDRLPLAAGMRVLEIACGAGSLWRENLERVPRGLALVVSDASIGMVRATRAIVPGASCVTCALPVLPFAGARFELVIANHMLYHVEKRHEALMEIRRVLRPGGALFATTNGADHLREIHDLIRDSREGSASFTLENGEEQLRRVFAHVERDDYADSLRVTDADALVRYVASIRPDAAEDPSVRALVERRIAAGGAFHVRKSTGLFIARNG